MKRVAVTGLGLVTPLGVGVQYAWPALLAGRSGVIRLEGPEWSSTPSRVAAMVPEGQKEGEFDGQAFSQSEEARIMSKAMKFALIAADEALSNAGWDVMNNEKAAKRSGASIGTAMVDLDYAAKCRELINAGRGKRVGPYFVPRLLPNLAAGYVALKHNLRGPNLSPSTACATGAHAIGEGLRAIAAGSADVMVCGGSEACVSPLVVNGFCRARALSTDFNENPEQASRPFDAGRDGFVIGEGASVLVLEALDHALARKATIYGEIRGYGLSGDAHHVTAGREDGEGALAAMLDALRQGDLSPGDLWCINAHATSTPRGDKAEMTAISKLLVNSDTKPAVVSNKGNIGHLLGAAGSAEAAFTMLALHHNTLPANVNVDHLDADLPCAELVLLETLRDERSCRHVLKNSFGFGGTNVSLVLSQYQK